MASSTDLATRLSEAEERIAQLETELALYQRIVNTLPFTIFWKDRESRFLGGNAQFIEMAGLTSVSEILGKNDHDMPWRGTQADAFRADDRMVMEQNRPKLHIIEPITRADGSNLWLETNKIPITNDSGAVIGIIGTIDDITIRKMEEEAQQAAIRELSTPLIPVAEEVVVMPLVGNIDSSRAQQIIEILLEGVVETRAKTAIIDITGVQVVDTQVANAILRAAQAVRLLGTSVVLTGISPEVAQTLVGLGADMSGLTTRSTLQSAITQALKPR